MSDQAWNIQGGIVGLSKFIGPHHVAAARSIISPRVDINSCVAGSEKNFDKNAAIARKMGFADSRIHRTVKDMLHSETPKTSTEPRFGIVATPNYLHVDQCIEMAKAGFHVVCDKPLGRTASEADKILDAVTKAGVKSCVTATYCGHSAIIEMRHRIRKILREKRLFGGNLKYFQRWFKKKFAEMTAEDGVDQAGWRKDPEQNGEAGSIGDIMAHLIFQLLFVTGLRATRVWADRRFVVEGEEANMTDDQGTAAIELEGGAVFSFQSVQYAGGHQNDNSMEIWLEDGLSYGWDIRQSEFLWETTDGGPRQILTRDDFQSPIHKMTYTMPSVHVDGWHDADGRLINSFAREVLGLFGDGEGPFHPDVLLARNVNAIIDSMLASAKNEIPRQWVKVDWRD